jgi:hypothetical protein
MTAMRNVALIASAGEAAIATEAVAASGSLAPMGARLDALFAPEVLAGLAAVAAALFLIEGLTAKNTPAMQLAGSQSTGSLVRRQDGSFAVIGPHNPRSAFNPTRDTRRISRGQAERQFGVNLPGAAIRKAIEDSPRYTHAIYANQKAVDAFNKSLVIQAARQREVNALDKSHGIVPKSTQQQTIQQWINIVRRAQSLMLANPTSIKYARAFEQVQKDLNARFKNQPVLLAAINDVLGTYNSQVKQAADNSKTLGVTFQDVQSGLMNMANQFKSQEESIFGTLFQGPFTQSPFMQNQSQAGYLLSGKDLLKDLKSQVTQFKGFHNELDQLAKRGAPLKLVQQIEALGPAAVNQQDAFGRKRKSLIDELLGLPPSQLQAYFSTFNTGQKTIQQQALKDLSDQLKVYRQHGRNIALAIIAGLKDENVAMTAAITMMIKRMFPGLPVGETGAGGKPTHKAQTPKTPSVVNNNSKVEHHTHYHIVTPKKDQATIKAQIKHADLTRRNNYSGRGGVPR